MASNPIDELGKLEVPPVPDTFEAQLHRRVNHRLLLLHIAEFLLRSVPYATLHFFKAVAGTIVFSVKGKP